MAGEESTAPSMASTLLPPRDVCQSHAEIHVINLRDESTKKVELVSLEAHHAWLAASEPTAAQHNMIQGYHRCQLSIRGG